MKYLEQFEIYESHRADLYHALKIDYALAALENNKLDAYTFQRYWPDGRRRKDDESDYSKSYYYRGISLTRDIDYAKNWECVIFVFDQGQLNTKYKIVPYNWGYSIGGGYEQKERVKREREEFLITSLVKKEMTGVQLSKSLTKSGGSIAPLDRFLKGFYISKKSYDIYTKNGTQSNSKIDRLMSNPLFMGLK